MTTDASIAIAISGLTKQFGAVTAVDHLDLEVRRGELFGLVGPDGAGKTTTLRMLSGVLRPTSGDALVLGRSASREPERVKHSIAYMSQRFGLYADLTVLENLDFYADLYEVPREERLRRLERLFEFSGLSPFRDRLAGALSGGMKQKLGLSCALIHTPEVLLLDEPTFGVDPISRRDLWIIVHEMVAEGVTVVASTSYMDEAERFDRVAMIHRGRLVALDQPDALLRSFSGELLAVRGRPLQRVRKVAKTLPAVRRTVLFGDRIHLTVDRGTSTDAIFGPLEREGIEDLSVRPAEVSLEDFFVERIDEKGQVP